MCLSIAVRYPEKVLGRGEHLGYEWIVTNNGFACRCGYVRVPAGHPFHGKDWNDLSLDVHGGITFGEKDFDCEQGRDESGWWLGFDCSHAWDASDPDLPLDAGMSPLRGYGDGVVRSQAYVEDNCINLCKQAAAAVSNVS